MDVERIGNMGQESCVLASSMLPLGQVAFLLCESISSSLEEMIIHTFPIAYEKCSVADITHYSTMKLEQCFWGNGLASQRLKSFNGFLLFSS